MHSYLMYEAACNKIPVDAVNIIKMFESMTFQLNDFPFDQLPSLSGRCLYMVDLECNRYECQRGVFHLMPTISHCGKVVTQPKIFRPDTVPLPKSSVLELNAVASGLYQIGMHVLVSDLYGACLS